VSCYDDAEQLFIFRIEERTFTSIYLPWKTKKSFMNFKANFLPYVFNGNYYYFINTLIHVNYTGFAKYQFGPISDIKTIALNDSNEEMFEYDDRFITLTPTYLEMHSGNLEYSFGAYDVNHIAYSEIIHKSDYKFLKSASTIKNEEGD
jgi:hypothetical protein